MSENVKARQRAARKRQVEERSHIRPQVVRAVPTMRGRAWGRPCWVVVVDGVAYAARATRYGDGARQYLLSLAGSGAHRSSRDYGASLARFGSWVLA